MGAKIINVSSTHSLLVVAVHEILVPAPKVREALELGHRHGRRVPSMAHQLSQVGHDLSLHVIGYPTN